MKIPATLLFIFFAIPCVAQSKKSVMKVVHVTLTARYKPANISILKNHVPISAMEMSADIVKYKDLESGLYSFIIYGVQGQFETKDSIFLKKGELLEIELKATCLHDRPVDYVPFCPKKHTDNIIPIFYGLILQINDDSEIEK